MATYKEIQDYVKAKYGRVVKTCWIADVKSQLGLPVRASPNRMSPTSRVHPCPADKKPWIEDALRYFSTV